MFWDDKGSGGPPVAFAVGPIVLLVVRHQICQGEAVMGCYEVDRVRGASASPPLLPCAGSPPVPFTCKGLISVYMDMAHLQDSTWHAWLWLICEPGAFMLFQIVNEAASY